MRGKVYFIVALCALATAAAQARDVKTCGALGRDAVDVARSFKSCITSNIACGDVRGQQVFGNNEGRLPGAGKNQSYREGRVGADRAGAGGVRRLVFLVGGGAKQTVIDQYYTDDHYETFCKIN